MEEKFLTIPEVARILRLSKSIVYAMVQKRQIPYVRITEKRVLIKESALLRWVESKVVK